MVYLRRVVTVLFENCREVAVAMLLNMLRRVERDVGLTPAFKPGSHMPPTCRGRGRRHGLGQRCGICEDLSPTHNLSQTLTAGLPAKLNSTQLRRQVGGECLGQIMCRR